MLVRQIWPPVRASWAEISAAPSMTKMRPSADIGGAVPGSVSPAMTSIFQEGFRIPPMKLVKGGVPNDDLFGLLLDRALHEFSRVAHEGNLAGEKNKGAGVDALGIRPEGGRRVGGTDNGAAHFTSSYQAIWIDSRIDSLDFSGSSPKSSNSITILWSFGKLSLSGSWSGNASINA